MFENIREDWRTHDRQWSRHGSWRPARLPLSFLYKVLHFLATMWLGAELPCEAVLGSRFCIEHIGGIVVSGDAVFGDDCVIRNGVTVGLRHRGRRGSPRLGNRVDIGAGAKLLGPISIGDDTAIGANAVVLCDVPANSIAVGIPARILPRRPSPGAPAAPEAVEQTA
jgi:serine O-acetyltransferase